MTEEVRTVAEKGETVSFAVAAAAAAGASAAVDVAAVAVAVVSWTTTMVAAVEMVC